LKDKINEFSEKNISIFSLSETLFYLNLYAIFPLTPLIINIERVLLDWSTVHTANKLESKYLYIILSSTKDVGK
jgi:hypothetical protein